MNSATNNKILRETVAEIFAQSKGILAMDESNPTCNKRFADIGIEQTEEMRRRYRELIVTTPGLNESIGGAILSDETIHQKTSNGRSMISVLEESGIVPGIKVDAGAKPLAGFPNEKVTEGLDELRERLEAYKQLGARFAKWRAVITIGDGIPTDACINANMHALARYAALCQEAAIVPIVEPEVLMDGNHDLETTYRVTAHTLKTLFNKLYYYKVQLEGIILKPNMVMAGKGSSGKNSVSEVAQATIECFLHAVPAAVPAIAFLSGGQSAEDASAHLSAMNQNYRDHLPWMVAFSFARAIQQPALHAWKGEEANRQLAQELLYHRAKLNKVAREGAYKSSMEK